MSNETANMNDIMNISSLSSSDNTSSSIATIDIIQSIKDTLVECDNNDDELNRSADSTSSDYITRGMSIKHEFI
jgi:hypothetical protein